MKSIIQLKSNDVVNVDLLAGKIHNAICSYQLLRGRAPDAVHVHPHDMHSLLNGVVERVIFSKGIALKSDDSVRRGTLQLVSVHRAFA